MVFIVFPSLFLLAILGVIGYAVWCCVCFRVGHWFAESISSQRRAHVTSSRHEASPRARLEASPPASPAPRQRHERQGCGRSGRNSPALALILAMLAISLLFFGFQARSTHVAPPFAPPPPLLTTTEVGVARPPAGEVPGPLSVDQKPVWKVTGRGATRSDAEEIALNEACAAVKTYLNDQLHLRWNPSQQYFQKYVKTQMVKDVKYEGTHQVAGLGTVHEVSLRVEMSPENHKDLMRRDRLFLFAKLLGIAVALLATGAVYIRLDEFSKGYYTAWLRLVAITIAAGTCTGWWLLTFG